jgi:hypothetical protein
VKVRTLRMRAPRRGEGVAAATGCAQDCSTWRGQRRSGSGMAEGTTSPKSELAVWATSKNGPAVPPFVPPAQVGTGALGEFIMSQPTEEQIRKRAFELWEQAGKHRGEFFTCEHGHSCGTGALPQTTGDEIGARDGGDGECCLFMDQPVAKVAIGGAALRCSPGGGSPKSSMARSIGRCSSCSSGCSSWSQA